MLVLIIIFVGALFGALLDNFLGVHIIPTWKQLIHILYYMALGAVINNA
jgi:F0F1-type ATP synthase assembly protein I